MHELFNSMRSWTLDAYPPLPCGTREAFELVQSSEESLLIK